MWNIIKNLFTPIDPLDKTMNELLKKRDFLLMLDKLSSLFGDNHIQTVTQILGNCQNFVNFLEQRVNGDAAKLNEAIDHLKTILDGHKKQQ